MTDIEVHIDLEGRTRPVGLAHSNKVRGTENVILVAGVHGLSGAAATAAWAKTPNTKVYGPARRQAKLPDRVEGVAVDLLDREDV